MADGREQRTAIVHRPRVDLAPRLTSRACRSVSFLDFFLFGLLLAACEGAGVNTEHGDERGLRKRRGTDGRALSGEVGRVWAARATKGHESRQRRGREGGDEKSTGEEGTEQRERQRWRIGEEWNRAKSCFLSVPTATKRGRCRERSDDQSRRTGEHALRAAHSSQGP